MKTKCCISHCWKIILLLQMYIMLIQVKCENPPDITLLSKKENFETFTYTCVAGNNVANSAITFITPLGGKYTHNTPVSEYRDQNGVVYHRAAFDCDFEINAECTSKWTNKFVTVNESQFAKTHNLAPVIDERWQRFETRLLDMNSFEYTINSVLFNIGISIRAGNKANVLLCDQNNPATCYWISLKNGLNLQVYKCDLVDTANLNTVDILNCKLTVSGKKVSLSEKFWTHIIFNINQNNEKEITIEEIGKKMPLIKLMQSESWKIKRMYLWQEKGKGLWKILNYRYLSLSFDDNKFFELGPEIHAYNSDELCVALHVAVCETCSLTISLNQKSFIAKGIPGQSLQPWQLVRLETPVKRGNYYRLKVTGSGGVDDAFWAIDDIRLCHNNETRVTTMKTTINKTDNISCQALEYSKYYSTKGIEAQTKEQKICDDVKYIGEHCNITCMSAVGEEYCNKHTICKPTAKILSMCACAAGYWGDDCVEGCNAGNYGYNCQFKCKPCKGFCLKLSGKCPPGKKCQSGDKYEGCELPDIPILTNPPILVKSNLYSITVRLNTTETRGKESAKTYQIEYKKKDSLYWTPANERQNILYPQDVSITNLTPVTEYNIRAIVYTDNGRNDKGLDIPYTTIATICKNVKNNKLIKDIEINTNSTDLLIKWTPVCDGNLDIRISCEAKWCPSEIITKTVSSIDKTVTINNLIPNTNYVYRIQKADSENVLYETNLFQTKPGKFPRLQVPPIIANTTLSSITIHFDSKNIVGEKQSQAFEIQYRESGNKMSWTKWQSRNILKDGMNIVVITNLKKRTAYHFRVAFYTTDNETDDNKIPYVTAKTDCTENTKNVMSFENIDIKAEENRATVRWTAVCDGKLEIRMKCVNEMEKWCAPSIQSVDTSREIININMLFPYTTYVLIINDNVSSKQFTTKASAPPAVRDLQVYSFDENSISLRWMAPYPPAGKFAYYEKFHSACDFTNQISFSSIVIQSCTLWSSYECFTINNVESKCYKIQIQAFNDGVTTHGHRKEIQIRPTKQTEAPFHLNIKETKEICWQHPNFTKGNIIAFEIAIEQIDTVLKQNFPTLIRNFNVNQQLTYCYKLPENIPLSSTYKITVSSRTKSDLSNPAAHLYIADPVMTQLVGNVSIIRISNTTQEIIIPGAHVNTITTNSWIYILVCDKNQNNFKPKDSLHSKLQKNSKCTGDSWIAAKLQVTENEQKFMIGDNSTNLNSSVMNIPLKSTIDYSFNVVIFNEYKGKQSYAVYAANNGNYIDNPVIHNPALYALFLLLLLPVIVWIMYRYGYQKANNRRQFDNITEVPIIPYSVELDNLLPATDCSIKTQQNITPPPLLNITETKEEIYSRVVKINELSQYIKESLENCELEKQHAKFVKGPTKPWVYGMKMENKFKNRYNNLSAYDHTRVVLAQIVGDVYSDFINANYIDGYNQSRAYIATQGPKPNTMNDFWRMIWQEKVQCIVMLTNLIEAGKKKCEQYWPNLGDNRQFINVSVTFLKADIYANFEYRTFKLQCDQETRMIKQFHFTSWPDHGVPVYPESLLPFLRKLLIISTKNAPIVVHCSAGVGRTGTIILTDICLRMAASENQLDAFRYLQIIRDQRANLVDNFDQYKLVHMLVLECLLAPKTDIPCDNLESSVNDLIRQGGIKTQMDYLDETAWHNNVMKTEVEIAPQNKSKNRFPDITPGSTRIYISRYPYEDEYSDYINAVPVDGFCVKDQFIVTQYPLLNTVADFWRMVGEQNVKVIVALNEIMVNDKTCCDFWPLPGVAEMSPMSHLTIKCQSIRQEECYDIFNLQLNNMNAEEGSELTNLNLIRLKNWKRKKSTPNNTDDLIKVLEEAQNLSRHGNPMVVACHDGATASGLFAALSFVIEKIKLEQICDVCFAVKNIRCNRRQFIKNKEQYEFLYKSAITYINSFDMYANFK